jgi:hypothetical protein
MMSMTVMPATALLLRQLRVMRDVSVSITIDRHIVISGGSRTAAFQYLSILGYPVSLNTWLSSISQYLAVQYLSILGCPVSLKLKIN